MTSVASIVPTFCSQYLYTIASVVGFVQSRPVRSCSTQWNTNKSALTVTLTPAGRSRGHGHRAFQASHKQLHHAPQTSAAFHPEHPPRSVTITPSRHSIPRSRSPDFNRTPIPHYTRFGSLPTSGAMQSQPATSAAAASGSGPNKYSGGQQHYQRPPLPSPFQGQLHGPPNSSVYSDDGQQSGDDDDNDNDHSNDLVLPNGKRKRPLSVS